MKRFNLVFLLLTISVCFCLAMGSALAQDTAKEQLLSVHEDNVVPSKVEEYGQAALGLVNAIRGQKSSSISHTAASMDDFTYIYFTPVENLGAVVKISAGFADLEGKMGKDAFGAVIPRRVPALCEFLRTRRPALYRRPI